jgi:hypothetical protein
MTPRNIRKEEKFMSVDHRKKNKSPDWSCFDKKCDIFVTSRLGKQRRTLISVLTH